MADPPARNPEVAGGETDVQQAANQLEAAAPEPAPVDTTGLPQGVDWQDGEDSIPDKFANEDEEILFSDPQGLGRNMPDPASGAGQGAMPASVARRLPALARAAQDPNAPASLKAIHRLLAQQLENELRG